MYQYIFDTANETHQGLPDGMQGYLAACYRSRIRNQIESRIENRKEPNGPIRKSNCLTKKKFHIPCATLNSYLG